MFTLAIYCFDHIKFTLIHEPKMLCSIVLYSIRIYFCHQSHPQLGIVFALAPFLRSFCSYFSSDLKKHIGHLMTWGVPLLVSYHIASSYCSWGSQGKNTEVACHFLLRWTRFCQTSPPWPACLGLPLVWFHWVRQGCGPSVIRFTSFLWLWI